MVCLIGLTLNSLILRIFIELPCLIVVFYVVTVYVDCRGRGELWLDIKSDRSLVAVPRTGRMVASSK